VGTGMTPLVKAERLGRRLGLKNLYLKNDAVNMPTLSFKDRVVSVALTRAKELGFTTVSCASTGNWPTPRLPSPPTPAWTAPSSSRRTGGGQGAGIPHLQSHRHGRGGQLRPSESLVF